MLSKLKRKSGRVRDALRRTLRSARPEPPVIYLESMSWDELEALVRSLNDKPGEFSELTSAIDRLSACVKMFDAQARTRPEYSQLRIGMNELFAHLARDIISAPILPSHGSHERIKQFARSLERQIEPLIELEKSLNAEEALGTNDLDEVLMCYRRIRTLSALLLLSENTAIWKIHNVEEIAARLESFPHTPAAYYRYSGPDAVPRNGCMPGTREAVLQELRDWVHYGRSQNIRWLNGTSGVGKTAVAYSLCDYLESTGKPFACVFCSRQHIACRDVNQILPTISYQLAHQSLPFRSAILSELEQGLDVSHLPFDDQFKKLIATPLGRIGHTFISDPVIVIDGIEDCQDKDMVYRLLRVLVEQVSKLPIKLLLSISPSRITHKYMRGTPGERHWFELRIHELDCTVARADIRTYLGAKLEDLALSTTKLEQLSQRSGASFVYATALVRYLGEANSSEHVERLQRLLEISDPVKPNCRDPDVRYIRIVQAILHGGALEDSTRGEILMLLRTATHEEAPPTLNIAASILGLDFTRNTQIVLSLLLPVLCTSGSDGLMLSFEKAFATYLLSQSHFDRLYHSPAQAHAQLAHGCFDVIQSMEPLFNVCDLESSYLTDQEVPYLTERVTDVISPGLFYACLHWAKHLELTDMTKDLYSRLEVFLSTRLLFWMEVLNLKKCISTGATLLCSIHKRLQRSEFSAKLLSLVEDACGFVSLCSTSHAILGTPHIYISALQFWSRRGLILECYGKRLKSLVNTTADWPTGQVEVDSTTSQAVAIRLSGVSNIVPGAEHADSDNSNTWPVEDVAQPLAGHTYAVLSVAYSPDGACLVSGSYDNTIRIWDARSGKPIGQPLKGHTGSVRSVVYSADGAYIASGSYDKTVRIWDAQTGRPISQPLTGHIGSVWSVAWSPDGVYMVSGSDDNTIRIWNVRTGKPVGQPLTGHTHYVQSVAFSPDGASIVSGSQDNTVRIWDACAGMPVGTPLTGHTSWVWSVKYSPDGTYIVSGSNDKTIRIWHAHNGKSVGQPLTGHTAAVLSVAYSPHDAYIVSGSSDKSIWIWDARTGEPIGQPLTGHTASVYSVAYSPDGAYVVSSSYDHSIHIWFAPTRPEPTPVQPFPPSGRLAARYLAHPFRAVSRSISRTTHTSQSNHTHEGHRMLIQQATITTPITASPHDWTLKEDGWVLGPNQERLLWVPLDLRDILAPPRTRAVMSTEPSIVFDFREAKLGLEWQECYNSS